MTDDTLDQDVKFSVAFILLDEFTLFALAGFVDALRLGGDQLDNSRQRDFHWTIISPDMEPIRSNSGVEVMPWECFPDPDQFDYLVVVGGRVEPQRKTDQKTIEYIRNFATRGGFIISLCTATFVLARTGIMKDHYCCVHWHHREEFEAEFPDIRVTSDTMFQEDRNFITCPGGNSSTDVALHIIEKHCGPTKARKAASGMVIEEIRSSRSPQPNVSANWFMKIHNPLLQRAIIIMDQSISETLSMADLANHLQVSENKLFRIFKQYTDVSPAKLFRALRLAHGHWSLHHTDMSISQIAHRFQFSDASHFSKMHKLYYGITPAAARASGPAEHYEATDSTTESTLIKHIIKGELFLL